MENKDDFELCKNREILGEKSNSVLIAFTILTRYST